MPIYEYQCSFCKYKFDELQKINDVALTVCPKCGKNGLHKLVSALNFRLKGTGWYKTDYKNSVEKPSSVKPTEGKQSEEKSSGNKPVEATKEKNSVENSTKKSVKTVDKA